VGMAADRGVGYRIGVPPPTMPRVRLALRGIWFALCLAPAVAASGPAGCGDSSSPAKALPGQDAAPPAVTQSIFVVPASLDALSDVHFYDHPWPSDFRLDPDGSIHMGGFYNPDLVPLITDYIQASVGLLKGFSPVAAGYLRFTGDINPATLPASPQASILPTSSVQIVDVDPSSPQHGTRHLAETFWQQADGVYWLHDTLAVAPALGYPLRRNNRYAIVITTAVLDTKGNAIAPSPDLVEVLGTPSAHTQVVHDLFAPAVAELATLGVPASQIAHLTVFTTTDPTADLYAVRDDVRKNQPAPKADPTMWTKVMQATDYDVYQGWYGPVPNYQAGTPPYQTTGGNFVFSGGKPVLQNTSTMRFTLVVPNATACPPPASGYPMNLYATGTGGDYSSVIGDVGDSMGKLCIASMGVDEIFEGARPGAPSPTDPNLEGDEDLLFFNLNNPIAARTSGQQSAIDVVTQARLFTDSHMTVPASLSYTGKAIAFDASNMGFFGHSEGSLSGSMFLAADDQVRGGVLSGSGSMITVALLEKTLPTPSVAQAVKSVLELTHSLPDGGNEGTELNLFHPVLNFAQALVDATDPVHYVGDIFQHPRKGFAPKSVYQTEGVNADGTGDSYAPPHGIEIGSVATGLPRQAPGVHTIVEAAYGGLGDVTVPAGGLSGNLAGGLASGVLAQFVPPPGHDGHFVVFDVPQAQAQAAGFCLALTNSAHGRVPALQ
jgi:hypothetical protein